MDDAGIVQGGHGIQEGVSAVVMGMVIGQGDDIHSQLCKNFRVLRLSPEGIQFPGGRLASVGDGTFAVHQGHIRGSKPGTDIFGDIVSDIAAHSVVGLHSIPLVPDAHIPGEHKGGRPVGIGGGDMVSGRRTRQHIPPGMESISGDPVEGCPASCQAFASGQSFL